MENKFFCLVMAGGKGTRFWPESTSSKPKQYLSFLGENSLLTNTLLRLDGLIPKETRYIVTLKEQENLVRENSKNLCAGNGLIFEPSGRNTAASILFSLAYLLDDGANEEDIVCIIPSDHVILNQAGFRKTLATCKNIAEKENMIVTIGIVPTFPHTGFGYLQKGEKIRDAFKVAAFKEKPNLDLAKEYIVSGNYFWNAGMFISKIGVMLKEFSCQAPHIFDYFNHLRGKSANINKIYNLIPIDSVDYAVMEKSEKVLVVPAEFDWNDLGSWEALESVLTPVQDNILVKCENHYLEQSQGNIVYAPNQMVCIQGVNDLIIVSNEKVLMILPKSQSQKVKDIVENIKFNKELQSYL